MTYEDEEPQDERPVHNKKITVKLTREEWVHINQKATRRRITMSEVVRTALRREMRK